MSITDKEDDMQPYELSMPPQMSEIRNAPERQVVFVLLPHVAALDLAGPVQVFHSAKEHGARYTLTYSSSQSVVTSAQGLVFADLAPLPSVGPDDLVIVPGFDVPLASLDTLSFDPSVTHWIAEAYQSGATIASICTGAFLLGTAGLLDGRRCTTHWVITDGLQVYFPRAHVLDNVLYVHDQRITTTAGVASGIDMALSLIEQDYGALLAAKIAHYLVIYMRRNGSQTQTSIYLQYRTHLHPGVHRAQDLLIGHLDNPVSLEQLAQVAQMSVRSFSRAFKEATGLTPVQYHQQLRLELAANLLQNPELTVEDVALKCGFEDVRHFRRLWSRSHGSPPSVQRLRH